MNQAVRDYVKSVIDRHPDKIKGARVLEIGSYNVNGTIRDLFEDAGCASYLGVDIRPGPGVDLVVKHYSLNLGRFGVIVCCEVLEHDPNPKIVLDEPRYYHLDSGGLLIVTTRGIGYGLHDEPEDYYRFTPHGLRYVMGCRYMKESEVVDHKESMGVFGYAIAN